MAEVSRAVSALHEQFSESPAFVSITGISPKDRLRTIEALYAFLYYLHILNLSVWNSHRELQQTRVSPVFKFTVPTAWFEKKLFILINVNNNYGLPELVSSTATLTKVCNRNFGRQWKRQWKTQCHIL